MKITSFLISLLRWFCFDFSIKSIQHELFSARKDMRRSMPKATASEILHHYFIIIIKLKFKLHANYLTLY